jgi:hypothetical protein
VKRDISILGHRVRILPLAEQGEDRITGFCDTAQETIYISRTLSAGAREEVLLHEVVHYISDTLGKELTEDQVKGISAGLYSAGVRIR